ncbi:MAG: M1 family aminopeptidase [Acidobacteriota bacterium]
MSLLPIVGFELAHHLRRISTWVYFALLSSFSFLFACALGGAFPGSQAGVAGTDGHVFVNSPYVIASLVTQFSVFGMLITVAICGHAGYRDFGDRMHPLVFTTPASKWSLLIGRFAATLFVNLFVFSGLAIGWYLGSFWPGLEADQFQPHRLQYYVSPYLLFVFPNLLFAGAIFFGLAALTRQRLPHFLGGVILLAGYLIANTLAGDVENTTLAALLDPFGLQAFFAQTQYWTTVEKNGSTLSLSGLLLINRLIWCPIGLFILGVTGWFFQFRQEAFPGRCRKEPTTSATLDDHVTASPRRSGIDLPKVRREFGRATWWAQFLVTLRRSFLDIIANVYFVVIMTVGVLFLLAAATQVGTLYGTTTYPVTYQVLEALSAAFALFLLITITFYAGELVWHERDVEIDQVIDTTPSSNAIPYLAKLTALLSILAGLLGVVLVAGVLTQLVKGYTNLELSLYLRELYGVQLPHYVLLVVLALAIQALVNHKYVGHFLMVAYFFSGDLTVLLGFEHHLWTYNSTPGTSYSDMADYGWSLGTYWWFKLPWIAVALLLAILSNLFWVRGRDTNAGWRLALARLRFRAPVAVASGLTLLAALGLGGFVFYNTNVLNTYRNSDDVRQLRVRYEKDYRQYLGMPQPRFTAMSVEVDLYPETGDLATRGQTTLKNKTAAPIPEIHLQLSTDAEVGSIEWNRETRLTTNDEELGYRVYRLATPLDPGEEIELAFDLTYEQRGFPNGGLNTRVVGNGSFVHSPDIFPSIGYDERGELGNDRQRSRSGLPVRERMRDLDDPEGRKNNYVSIDSDWVDFEAVVSTVPDQIAIAPGYLQKEWTENGRRYFHYAMDSPIINFTSFLSARYEVARDNWNDVAIEVYHHPAHHYNVDRMIEAVKKSLDYYTVAFSPYQHRQVRIIEFPRWAAFAQAFPNTIPYSEAIGFITRVDEGDIDYPFYVTAHEIAHQWWAHQVIGANVQGSTMMSETFSQYSALMVMEKEYGEDAIGRFLRYELDMYLHGRSLEAKKEVPLLRVENQHYIHYQKGSLVMYRLRQLLGEDVVNEALKSYIEEVGFQEPPYTTARDFLAQLRAVTPPKYQETVTDLFERVVLYENAVEEATWVENVDGGYEVELTFTAKKLHADELGEQTEVELGDWIEIGVRDSLYRLLYRELHHVSEAETRLTLTVPKRPWTVSVDPLCLLVDRDPNDNEIRVREKKEGSGGGTG